MSTEDPHPEGTDFDEAIDSLLNETDPVRADDESTDAPSDPESALDAQGDPKELGDAAFDAIDSVEQSAQSLLEDAIESLLDETDASEPQGDPAEADAISTDEINAQLDALENPEARESVIDEDLDALSHRVDALETLDDEQPGEPEPADAHEIEEGDADAAEEHAASPIDQPADDGIPEDEPASMPDAADSLSDDDLISSIAADLMEADQTEPAQEEAEHTPDPEPEPAPDPSDQAVDEPSIEQAADAEEDESARDTESPVDGTEPESTDEEDPLADAIDQLIESADESDTMVAETSDEQEPVDVSDEADPEPAPETEDSDTGSDPALEDASTLADLDASLAGIGDDLLMGDFETPEGERVGSDDLGINDASSLLDMLDMGDLDLNSEAIAQTARASEPSGEMTPAEDAAHPQPAQSEQMPPQAQPDPTPAQAPKPSPKPIASESPALLNDAIDDSPIPEVESIWQTARRIAIRAGQVAWAEARARAVPLGAKAIILINKPVRERPAIVRDSIGYLAMWTGLLATILWVYLAFIRVTPTPTPTQAPSRMLEPGEVIDPLRNANANP